MTTETCQLPFSALAFAKKYIKLQPLGTVRHLSMQKRRCNHDGKHRPPAETLAI
jgi:hypothetical protein